MYAEVSTGDRGSKLLTFVDALTQLREIVVFQSPRKLRLAAKTICSSFDVRSFVLGELAKSFQHCIVQLFGVVEHQYKSFARQHLGEPDFVAVCCCNDAQFQTRGVNSQPAEDGLQDCRRSRSLFEKEMRRGLLRASSSRSSWSSMCFAHAGFARPAPDFLGRSGAHPRASSSASPVRAALESLRGIG